MKKLLTFLAFVLASGMIFAQNQQPTHVLQTGTPIDVLSKCDQKLNEVSNPADGPASLTSTRKFGWFGNWITIEIAQQFHYPRMVRSGQVIEFMAFQGVSGGPAGEINIMRDVNNEPGPRIINEGLSSVQGNVVYDASEAMNAAVRAGNDYWVSVINYSDSTANVGPRWFWTTTASATNGANGHPPYYVEFTDRDQAFSQCARWTNHKLCTSAFQSGPTLGMNYRLSICRNASLNLGNGVPTMTQWGLFLFGLIVLTLGVVSIYNFSRKTVVE